MNDFDDNFEDSFADDIPPYYSEALPPRPNTMSSFDWNEWVEADLFYNTNAIPDPQPATFVPEQFTAQDVFNADPALPQLDTFDGDFWFASDEPMPGSPAPNALLGDGTIDSSLYPRALQDTQPMSLIGNPWSNAFDDPVEYTQLTEFPGPAGMDVFPPGHEFDPIPPWRGQPMVQEPQPLLNHPRLDEPVFQGGISNVDLAVNFNVEEIVRNIEHDDAIPQRAEDLPPSLFSDALPDLNFSYQPDVDSDDDLSFMFPSTAAASNSDDANFNFTPFAGSLGSSSSVDSLPLLSSRRGTPDHYPVEAPRSVPYHPCSSSR